MFSTIYLIAAVLCIWGGCLIARVIANRLELGLFRRKIRRSQPDTAIPVIPAPPRRSFLWTILALVVMLIGTGAAFIASGAEDMSGPLFNRGWTNSLNIAIVTASLGLIAGLGFVGFRFDPSLGRRRCPKCWYDLSATQSRLCAECGHEAPNEKNLYRTRRSKPTIVLAIILLLLLPMSVRLVAAAKYGWIGLVPTSFMILAFDHLPDSMVGAENAWLSGSATPGTLAHRVEQRTLFSFERAILSWRCASVVRNSNDPQRILMAVGLDETHQYQGDLLNRFPILIASLSDPDPLKVNAAAVLIQSMYYSNPKSEVILKAIADASPALLAAALNPPGSNESAATVATFLLLQTSLMQSLSSKELEGLEAILVNPATSTYRRLAAIQSLAQDPLKDETLDLLIRLFDVPNGPVRSELCSLIFRTCHHPRIIARAVQMIRDDSPAYAERAASALVNWIHQSNSSGELDIRQVTTTLCDRFLADPTSRQPLLPTIHTLRQRSVISDEQLRPIYTHLLELLTSRTQSDANYVKAILGPTPEPSPELTQAIDTLLSRPDLDQATTTYLRDLRDRSSPPDGK